VPLDAVLVLVVEDGETGLVVKLLQTLYCDANVVLCLDGPLPDTLVIVGLRLIVLSGGAPEGVGVGHVGGGDPGVAGPGPEPTVGVDRLQVCSVAALVLEVALASAGPDAGNVIFSHDLLEHFVLAGRLEGDEVHAPVPAKVPPVEPVPVLKLVPGFPPGEEVVMVPHLHVRFSFHALIEDRSVQQRFPVRPDPGWLLG